jgi:cilia- and flagella-associated protein 57
MLAKQSSLPQQQPSGLAQTNVAMTPKFLFGMKGDVQNSVLFLDNNTVCYPCGHNLVIYSLDDKQQRFIPGIEGSEGISALALNNTRKQLAVCETASKALCSVYNVGKMLETFRDSAGKKGAQSVFDMATIKKRKVLISNDYTARTFVSVDFSQTNDKLLVTLGDDCRIVVWQYDKQKGLAIEQLQVASPSHLRQVSFNNQGS